MFTVFDLSVLHDIYFFFAVFLARTKCVTKKKRIMNNASVQLRMHFTQYKYLHSPVIQ